MKTIVGSVHEQRKVMLDALTVAPVNTQEAREFLGIIHPAGRIHDLRNAGCIILTQWTRISALDGTSKRVAQYVLLKGPRQLRLAA